MRVSLAALLLIQLAGPAYPYLNADADVIERGVPYLEWRLGAIVFVLAFLGGLVVQKFTEPLVAFFGRRFGEGKTVLIDGVETMVIDQPTPGMWEVRLSDAADTRTFDWKQARKVEPPDEQPA